MRLSSQEFIKRYPSSYARWVLGARIGTPQELRNAMAEGREFWAYFEMVGAANRLHSVEAQQGRSAIVRLEGDAYDSVVTCRKLVEVIPEER